MVCRVDFKSKDTLDHYGLSEQIHTTPSVRMICKNIQILFSKLFEFRFQQNMILNFVFPTSLSVSSGFVLFFFLFVLFRSLLFRLVRQKQGTKRAWCGSCGRENRNQCSSRGSKFDKFNVYTKPKNLIGCDWFVCLGGGGKSFVFVSGCLHSSRIGLKVRRPRGESPLSPRTELHLVLSISRTES